MSCSPEPCLHSLSRSSRLLLGGRYRPDVGRGGSGPVTRHRLHVRHSAGVSSLLRAQGVRYEGEDAAGYCARGQAEVRAQTNQQSVIIHYGTTSARWRPPPSTCNSFTQGAKRQRRRCLRPWTPAVLLLSTLDIAANDEAVLGFRRLSLMMMIYYKTETCIKRHSELIETRVLLSNERLLLQKRFILKKGQLSGGCVGLPVQPVLRPGAHAQQQPRENGGNNQEDNSGDGIGDSWGYADGVHLVGSEHEGPGGEHERGAECNAGGAQHERQAREVLGRAVVHKQLFFENVRVCGKRGECKAAGRLQRRSTHQPRAAAAVHSAQGWRRTTRWQLADAPRRRVAA
jgi:hypothetical protein